jgi:hypothetical protein
MMRDIPLSDQPWSWNRRHSGAAAIAALLCGIEVGGCHMLVQPPRPPQHSPDVTTPTAGETAALRALFSIYYVALRERDGLPDPVHERYPPEDVVAAANLLAADQDAEAVSWKRRAIATLVGSSVPGATADQWRPESLRDALLALHAPLDKIYLALQAQPLTAKDATRYVALADAAWTVLNSNASPYPGKCCACLEQYHTDVGSAATPAMAFFQFNVQRPPGDVRIGMDPRCWASCNPPYFAQTFLVSDCSGKSTSQVGGVPNCGADTLKPGSVLLENVLFGAVPSCKPPQVQFQNLLAVTAAPQPGDGYLMNYAFCDGLGSAICGAQSGLSVDCGCTADKSDGLTGTQLHGVKYIRFCDPTLQNWTMVGLFAMVDEIGQQGACCGMTDPAGTCDPCNPAPDNPTPDVECAQCAATSTQPCPPH